MTDKMREEFEAWFHNELCHGCGKANYGSVVTMAAWKAWKASRAALRVELPKQWFDDGLGCDLMEVNHVADALDAAGVRYK